MKKLLIALICTISASAASQSTTVSFSTYQQVPIIEAKLNGKIAYFIIDTGSSISVLDINKNKSYKFKPYRPVERQSIGFGGEFSLYYVGEYKIHIDQIPIMSAFVCKDLSQITNLISENTGKEIVGIIGADVFKYYKSSISFVDQTISFNLQ